MSNLKVDISSAAVEKGLDIAREFLDKLIIPPVEEVGLLLRDKVTMWRIRNQIKMLNKTEEYCRKNNVNPKKISLKLLHPVLEFAALEEEETLQDKWALLLANMVDSEQNIENHVFPYILSQVSTKEFSILELSVQMNKTRLEKLKVELDAFRRENNPKLEILKERIATIDDQIKQDKNNYTLYSERSELTHDLSQITKKETAIAHQMYEPNYVIDSDLEEFEISNLQRLGLIKLIETPSAYVESHRIRNEPNSDYLYLEDAVVKIEPDSVDIALTELGKLFIEACTEKRK